MKHPFLPIENLFHKDIEPTELKNEIKEWFNEWHGRNHS